jgi:hypothetical protein
MMASQSSVIRLCIILIAFISLIDICVLGQQIGVVGSLFGMVFASALTNLPAL